MIIVKEFGIEEFSKISNEWKLLEKGDDMTPFQSYFWNTFLVNDYKAHFVRRIYKKLSYVVVYDDTSIVMIAPLRIKELYKGGHWDRQIELLGPDSFSDYCNFIYSGSCEPFLEKIIEYLKGKYKGFSFFVSDIPSESRFGECLNNYGNVFETNKTVWINLEWPSFNEYFNSLTKNTRQNYRTACNRIKKSNKRLTWSIVNRVSSEEIKKMIEINYKRSVQKNKDNSCLYFVQEWIGKYSNNFIRGLSTMANNLWALLVYVDNDLAGFLLGVEDDNTIFVMMNKVNIQYEFYSPIMVATIQCIQHLIEETSYRCLDFGRGTEKYKYSLGGTETVLVGMKMMLD